jgi:hypothetical protein
MSDLEFKGQITEDREDSIWFLIEEGIHMGTEVNLPKSQIGIIKTISGVTIILPEWLADQKELW